MRRIIETLLEEGIDESTIHKVLDLIEEEYEVVVEETRLPKKAEDAIKQLSEPEVDQKTGNKQLKVYSPEFARELITDMHNRNEQIKKERRALQKRGKELMKEREANTPKEEINQLTLFGGNQDA